MKISENGETARILSSDTLIGTFDILGATSMFAANDASTAESVVALILRAMSESVEGTIQKLKSYYRELSNDGARLRDLVERTSSYLYADTIVFTCNISGCDLIMMRFACEYFQFMAIEITRQMFSFGVPVRGCLSYGTIASYKDKSKIVLAGKAYTEAIKTSDALEFSGTVLTEELRKVIQKSDSAIEFPPLQGYLSLPCVVKDGENKRHITKDMWCLDWLDDTEFLKGESNVRQLITNSFAGHGKTIRDSVVGKIDNTETIVRMLITHRKVGEQ